jgi:glutamate formiminotransferase / 5-formyltetrahydrofolate cyclo-ligase
MKIIECVPNFSEGQDRAKIDKIADALLSIRGISLLDFSMDPDHHRSVFTFIGSPESVFSGAMAACTKAIELIDMREHSGVHPRIGAADVVPFIPLTGAKMQDAVSVAHRFGRKFGEEFRIPVYFYGEAALNPSRKELPEIRRGGYEGLREKMIDPHWLPDAGFSAFNERAGAMVIGARMPLIAFNVNLNTGDLHVAQDIAKAIRQSSGGLKHVKAIGVPLKSRNIVQVSMNLTNYRETSVYTAFDAVKEQASQRGASIIESELIGLIPEEALQGRPIDDLKLSNFCTDCIIETHIKEMISEL